ncbi:MAG: branched-chain amino acid ABC transporter permease [Verrucomicrobia bacterium]|nr:branched-chain amino acid ABC transporter permease [Verrucomicrobiota bacterium]
MSRTGANRRRLVFGTGVIVLAVLLPLYAGEYTVTTFTRIIYFGFLALSVGMLVGQAGMVSLTQTAFFGLSGYVIGLLGTERGMPFPLRDLIAIGAVLITALVFGLIAMRTHQIVFLMITLAFGQICWAFAQQNTSLLHGWAGIRGIRPPTILGVNFGRTSNFYWAALFIIAIGIYTLRRLIHSPFGLALNGIRENPRRMSALGYPVYWIRVASFLVAALYAGVGGILAAYSTGIVTPTTMQLSRTIWVLLTVILGGASYFWGPIVGTIIAVWLDVLISQGTARYNTVIGFIFLMTVLFLPGGVLSIAEFFRDRANNPLLDRIFRLKSGEKNK